MRRCGLNLTNNPPHVQRTLLDIASRNKNKKANQKYDMSDAERQTIKSSGDSFFFAMKLAEAEKNPSKFFTEYGGVELTKPVKELPSPLSTGKESAKPSPTAGEGEKPKAESGQESLSLKDVNMPVALSNAIKQFGLKGIADTQTAIDKLSPRAIAGAWQNLRAYEKPKLAQAFLKKIEGKTAGQLGMRSDELEIIRGQIKSAIKGNS